MAPYRHTTDGAWRTQVQACLADLRGLAALTVLGDLRQCYEHVDHTVVQREAALAGYPLFALRAALHTYLWPRFLVLDGAASEFINPDR
eukprot:9489412-Pyramimonas_sp.AAC.2